MTITCQHCGAVHNEPAERCSFCDTRFDDGAPDEQGPGPASFSRDNVTPTDGALAMQPSIEAATKRRSHPTARRTEQAEWKQEVRDRLRAYRVQHGIAVEDLQPTLPFEPVVPSEDEEEFPAHDAPPPAPLPTTPASLDRSASTSPRAPAWLGFGRPELKQPEDDRVEIAIPSSEIPIGVYHPAAAERSSKLDAIIPVAGLPDRRRAAVIDLALILFSFGAMLSIFWVLGGRLGWNKVDGIVTGITLGLFYAQYFALFTVFGASTPGMMLRGLRVVGFDGSTPSSQQMLWRSFGYLISAGTFLMGFLWALWDDDHLCWHDRISQTYLTMADGAPTEAASPPADS